MAWDFYNTENLPLYLEALRLNGGKYFGEHNATDYMSAPSVVMDIAASFVTLEEASN